MRQPDPVDPIAELERLADVAREGIAKLRGGHAINGVTTLQRVEAQARDAARHARHDKQTGTRR